MTYRSVISFEINRVFTVFTVRNVKDVKQIRTCVFPKKTQVYNTN